MGDQQTGTEPSSAPLNPRITPGGDTHTQVLLLFVVKLIEKDIAIHILLCTSNLSASQEKKQHFFPIIEVEC